MRPFHLLSFLCAAWIALAAPAQAAVAPTDIKAAPSSASLRAAYAQLRERLANNSFGRPLYLDTHEEDRRVTGDVYALITHPFADVAKPLSEAAQWCEILLLPFNTKHCEAPASEPDRLSLTIFVGRKYTTPLDKTHRLEFRFDPAVRSADYMQTVLTAPEGPFGTRDYRIVLEIAPVEGGRSFLHLSYAYTYGKLARAAMQAYLSTIGAHKVGFTIDGKDEAGNPAYVRGMRGVMERNMMRYYLAIEAYLHTRHGNGDERVSRMIDDWFAAVEKYPRQLHELEREEYVSMKRQEFRRMRDGVSPVRQTASSSP